MISYYNINESINYYEEMGFTRVKTPWMITPDISNITKPEEADEFRIFTKTRNDKVLVASGEQSFLYLYNKRFLPKGKFQTVTPCFRQEAISETHHKYFIKNELIVTDDVNRDMLMKVVSYAKEFFEYIISGDEDVKVVKTDHHKSEIGIDLVYKGIELGSYGIRKCSFLEWIYGTGCAEPRLSFAKKFNHNK